MTTTSLPPHDAALSLVAGLRIEDGRAWGDVAADFQVNDARAILDADASQRLHYLTRPRGGSKTTDLAAIALGLLLEQAPAGSRSYAVAADADQAALLTDAMAGLVARTEGLPGAVRVETKRIIAIRTDARLDVLPADAASAYGLRPWLAIVDELAAWPDTANARGVWAAIFSAMPKVPGARLVVLTTAGDPAHFSAKVLARARRSDAWRVSETPGPTPWVSAEALEERRAILSDAMFRRLHLNEWLAAEDRLVRPEDLAACVVLDGPQEPLAGMRYVVGVDLGLRHDRTAVAVAHAEPAPDAGAQSRRVVLDRLHVLQARRGREVSLADVEETIAEAARTYRARVRLDPWQAIGLAQRLRARGIRVEEYAFSSASVGRLASTLHVLLRDHLLALPDDEELLDELAGVRLRETTPGVLRMDHDSGRHDDRAIALALAATALVEKGAPVPATSSTAAGHAISRKPTSRVSPLKRGVAVEPARRVAEGWTPPLPKGRWNRIK